MAWNEDKQLLCHAHSKGVKVVVKHNFDDVLQLCNGTARQDWIKVHSSRNGHDATVDDVTDTLRCTAFDVLGSLLEDRAALR